MAKKVRAHRGNSPWWGLCVNAQFDLAIHFLFRQTAQTSKDTNVSLYLQKAHVIKGGGPLPSARAEKNDPRLGGRDAGSVYRKVSGKNFHVS